MECQIYKSYYDQEVKCNNGCCSPPRDRLPTLGMSSIVDYVTKNQMLIELKNLFHAGSLACYLTNTNREPISVFFDYLAPQPPQEHQTTQGDFENVEIRVRVEEDTNDYGALLNDLQTYTDMILHFTLRDAEVSIRSIPNTETFVQCTIFLNRDEL